MTRDGIPDGTIARWGVFVASGGTLQMGSSSPSFWRTLTQSRQSLSLKRDAVAADIADWSEVAELSWPSEQQL